MYVMMYVVYYISQYENTSAVACYLQLTTVQNQKKIKFNRKTERKGSILT